MFSFRTTPLEDQLDKALVEGRVGCFCTQSSWVPDKGRYVHEIFSERGNLAALFVPDDSGKIPGTGHIGFQLEAVRDLDAVVVEFQDAGSRYFNYSRDLFRLMDGMKALGDDAPSIYVVDHLNPAGRAVEGTVPASASDPHVPRVAHPLRPASRLCRGPYLRLPIFRGFLPVTCTAGVPCGTVPT